MSVKLPHHVRLSTIIGGRRHSSSGFGECVVWTGLGFLGVLHWGGG